MLDIGLADEYFARYRPVTYYFSDSSESLLSKLSAEG